MPRAGFAGHGAADLNLFETHVFDLAGDVDRDQLVFPDDHLVGDRVDDVGPADAAADGVRQADFHLFTAIDDAAGDPLGRAAVVRGDDHVLADVGQLAGEVTAVGRLEGRIGQSLAGTVGRAEVLEHGQAFAEVGLNRRLDDFAAGLGHQTTHAGQLTHLFDAATGTRVGHQEQRVHVVAVVAVVVLELVHHRLGDELASVRPRIEHLVVPLLIGDDALLEQLLLLEHRCLRPRR